jgi:hypothetical protein
MTIDAVRRKSARAAGRKQRAELPIGESDANIFDCPGCARPLAVGTRRCPGCSTRLLGGVRATLAAGFMATGLIVGLAVGGGTMFLILTLTAAPATAVTMPTDTTPGASAVPAVSAAPQAPVVDPTVAAGLSSLRQATLVNQRLVADAARLDAIMTISQPNAVEIARILRSLAATAAFGDRIAPTVADWPDARAISGGLVDFYAAVGATARDGLANSLTNGRAYATAGRAMIVVMDTLPAVDAAARSLAAAADTELPPLDPVAAP